MIIRSIGHNTSVLRTDGQLDGLVTTEQIRASVIITLFIVPTYRARQNRVPVLITQQWFKLF